MLKLFQKFNTFNESYEIDFYTKRQEINQHLNNIKTIIFGSSHGLYGYIAKDDEFNLCLASQDLYYSYKLYKKYSKIPKLENIVLFFSVFSPGHILCKTIEKEKAIYYEKYFNIPYQYFDKELIIKKFLYYIKPCFIENNIEFNNGNINNYWFFEKKKDILEKRTKSHLKNNKRKNKQIKYLEKIINLVQANKQNIYIILSPATKDYKNILSEEKEIFRNIKNISKKYNKLKIIDFYTSDIFNDNDFGDYDHLNTKGAKKLTKIVRKYINN